MPFHKKLFAGLLLWLFAAQILLQAASVNELRCEDLKNPTGVDAVHPRLSWLLDSSGDDQTQKAYQILVASSPKALAANQGDWWDSGKISSDQSIQVSYAGKPLTSRAQCFWKVRVWDQACLLYTSPSPRD